MLIIGKYNTKNRKFSCKCCVSGSHKYLGKIYQKKYGKQMKYVDYDEVEYRY